MDNLDLPNIKVQREGDQLVATHKKNEARLVFPVRQLEQWLVRKFKDDLSGFLKGQK